MDVQTPSPQTTLAVLFGASEWPDSPHFPGSKAFANAMSSFRKYLLDPYQFGLPKENLLDLFDVDDSPHAIDKKIRQFLERRILELKAAGNAARDLLVYFVGHGDFVGRNSEYYLAIRCTSTENVRLSSIPMESLASTITDKARYLRRIIILDCCYAAAAFITFQAEGPAQLGIHQAFDAFERKAKTVGKGTSLLCSSGKTVASQIAPDGSCTMFSKALLEVLTTGNKRRPEKHYLSLREVADLTEEVIDTKAPRPELHSPDQIDGNVAEIPFFPNLARTKELPPDVSPPLPPPLPPPPPKNQMVGVPRDAPRFEMSIFLVTNREFKEFLEAHPDWQFGKGFQHMGEVDSNYLSHWLKDRTEYPPRKAKHPVVNISRYAAEAYAAWRGDQLGKVLRLPTKDEWETAARAENSSLEDALVEELDPKQVRVNYGHKEGGTTAVGEFEHNRYGFYDLFGNVYELCACGNLTYGCGGSFDSPRQQLTIPKSLKSNQCCSDVGFRYVHPLSNKQGESNA